MSKLGFGLMRLPLLDGATSWSMVDLEKTKKMVDLYMEGDFCYFDTAYNYHKGNSEKIFGEMVAARYPRNRYKICDKMPIALISNPQQYATIFQDQIRKCRVDYFDNYFLHAIGRIRYEEVEKMHGFEFLKDRKEKGQIRKIGISFHDTAEILDMMLTKHPEIETVQLQLNFIDWDDEAVQSKLCYEVCLDHGVDVVVMEPLKGGTILNLPNEAIYEMEKYNGMSVVSWGLRFVASLDGVSVVLSGMSDIQQLVDNMSFIKTSNTLNEEERKIIKYAVELYQKQRGVQCTACGYCLDVCPVGIKIHEFIALYNNHRRFMLSNGKYGVLPGLINTYMNIGNGDAMASSCIKCGACEKMCPQKVDIRNVLEQITTLFEKENRHRKL